MLKVLLVDPNFSSIPIYKALNQAGHQVHVVGSSAQAPLAKICQNHWQLDYSDTHALRTLIEREQFDRIIPGCTDQSYESCASAGSAQNWFGDSLDNFNRLNEKARLRDLLEKLGLPSPRVFHEIESSRGAAVIIKPVDSYSGIGITLLDHNAVQDDSKAISIAKSTSKTGKFIVEEYVSGQLFSYSAFIKNKAVEISFLVREDCVARPFAVDTSRLAEHMGLSQLKSSLAECTNAIAQALGLADGLLHTQFIFDGSSFWIIEVTRRCPGDLYSMLIELSSGFPYAAYYSSFFVGDCLEVPRQPFTMKPVMRHTLVKSGADAIEYVRFLRKANLERFVNLCLPGDFFGDNGKNRAAIAFFTEKDQERLDSLYESALRSNLYTFNH